MSTVLYIVVPCYNEEEVLPETSARLGEKLSALYEEGRVSSKSRVLFVDDGSKDGTWRLIQDMNEASGVFCGVSLSHNRGHQNALLAGLMSARGRCDCVISMDADLQDDIDAVDRMLEEYEAGSDVVYGVRSAREKDTFFKRFTAEGYYKLLKKMGCEVVFNHADYRLLSARALNALAAYGEHDLFLRGIVPMLGYQTSTVEYERGERFAGESKYPLKKMLALAFDGIFSLSMKPIRAITACGIGLLILAAALFVFSIVGVCLGYTMLNWKLLTLAMCLIGGLILCALGILGEYIGRAYIEAKKRPRYNIGDKVGLGK